jgi:uncharacterized protein with FMN-binding domain
MRRSVPVLLATALGLFLLANFDTSPGQVVVATAPQTAPAPTTSSTTPPAGPPPSSGSSSPPSSSSGSAARTIDGSVVSNKYGEVQVRVSLSGSRVVDVQAVQLPFDRQRSADISNRAEPLLRREALQAQSANINTISGATYTSIGYRQSLQSALDQAGIH